MNLAMFLVAALALCALPSALSLVCYRCDGSLVNEKNCTSISEYTNQTCDTANATCGRTEFKSNVSDHKVFVLGCVEEPHNCTSYQLSKCANITTAEMTPNSRIEMCKTHCNKPMLNTTDPTDASTAATQPTLEATTAAAQVLRPEIIGMLIVLMAVFFGLQ